jgi:hypothetical protein
MEEWTRYFVNSAIVLMVIILIVQGFNGFSLLWAMAPLSLRAAESWLNTGYDVLDVIWPYFMLIWFLFWLLLTVWVKLIERSAHRADR